MVADSGVPRKPRGAAPRTVEGAGFRCVAHHNVPDGFAEDFAFGYHAIGLPNGFSKMGQ